MAKVLITGASGFVGKNVVDACLNAGLNICCQVHHERSAGFLRNRGIETFVCDLADTDSLIGHARGVSEVVHLAGVVCPYSEALAERVNVRDLVRFVGRLSRISSPPTFVYTSSLAASGPSIGDAPRVEEDICRPLSIYGRSKWKAEQRIKEFAEQMPISIVRPPGVFGPWDRNLLTMFKMVARGWNLIAISKQFRFSFIHASDLATGLLSIARRGQRLRAEDDLDRQGTYFLADSQSVTFVELAEMMAALTATTRIRHIVAPAIACWTLASGGELVARMLGLRVYLNWDKVREAAGGSWTCDSGRAAKELGFSPEKPFHERLRETYDWYLEHGWLTRS